MNAKPQLCDCFLTGRGEGVAGEGNAFVTVAANR
jgi:hypothetical protein